MAVDPSTFEEPSQDVPIQNLNYQAEQLFNSSLANTGQPPNPQFAIESLSTGATPDVLSAYGDPSVSPYLTAGPTGFGTAAYSATTGPMGGQANPYVFDQKSYDQQNLDQLHKNSQFASLGEVPVANVGYVQSIRAGDRDRVQKWQSWLTKTGFLDHNHSISGYWDADTDQALTNYFISLYTPQALFAPDSQTKAQAQTFLSTLTNGSFDPYKLSQQKIGDQANFLTELATGWVATQGQQDQKKALNDYKDQYGDSSLPKALQEIVNPGTWQSILDAGWSLGAAIPSLLGSVSIPFTGENNVSNFLNSISPQHGEEQKVEDMIKNSENPQLAKSDIAALKPALAQVAGDTGFLPFDFIDKQWNHLVLGTTYLTNEAFGNTDPSMQGNPFDPISPMGQKIAAHENNLGAGLFGDEWAKDHPTADTWFNFIADSADPAYWYGGWMGRGEKLGMQTAAAVTKTGARLGAEGITHFPGVEKLLGGAKSRPVSIGESLSKDMGNAVGSFLDPTGHLQRSFAHGIMAVKDLDNGQHDLRTMLRVFDAVHPDSAEGVKSSVAAMNSIRDAKSPEEVLRILKEDFPTVITGPSALHNMKTALRGITPTVMDRMSAGAVSRFRTHFGMMAADHYLPTSRPYEFVDQLTKFLYIAGVDEKEIYKIQKLAYDTNAEGRGQLIGENGAAWRALDKAVLKRKGIIKGDEEYKNAKPTTDAEGNVTDPGKTIVGEGIKSWVQQDAKIRKGGYFHVPDEIKQALAGAPKIRRAIYLPGKEGEELSKVSKLSPEEQDMLSMHGELTQHITDMWEQVVTREVDRIRKSKAGRNLTLADATEQYLQTEVGQKLKAQHDEQMQQIEQLSSTLAPAGEARPAPAFTSQLGMSQAMPASAYSLLVHMHGDKIGLQRYEHIAARLSADRIYSMWKRAALWQPGTSFRIAMGDDEIRPLLDLMSDGHAGFATKTFARAWKEGVKAIGNQIRHDVATSKLGKKATNEATQQKWDEWAQAIEQAKVANPDYVSGIKWMGDHDYSFWDTAKTSDPEYAVMYGNSFRVQARGKENRIWAAAYRKGGADAATKAVEEFFNSDSMAQELLSEHGGTAANWAQKHNQIMEMLHPSAMQKAWLEKGVLNTKQFQQLLKDKPELFHTTASPRLTIAARHSALSTAGNFTFHDIMEPLINGSRAEISHRLKDHIQDQITETTKGNPRWDEARIKATAEMEARAWVQNNMYQGHRSMLGTALRHVFPFMGATANMSKFFMRQFEKDIYRGRKGLKGKSIGAKVAARAFTSTGEQQRLAAFAESQQNNPEDAFKINGLASGALSMLGMGGGDSLSVNPARMLFFTNDGVGSFVPGLGPIFAPILGAVAKDPHLTAMFSDLPGIKEQLQFHSGDSDPMFSYIERTLSGIGLMSPIHHAFTVPVFGGSETGFDKQLDEKFAQMAAENRDKGLPPPTREEVANQLGRETLTQQAISTALPLGPRISDSRRDKINQADQAFKQATDPAQREAIIQQNPDVAPYLRYKDPLTPLSESDAIQKQLDQMPAGTTKQQAIDALGPDIRNNKDDIIQDHPWVANYTVGLYETNMNVDPGLGALQHELQLGDLHVKSLDEYSKASADQWENSNGWTAYENQVYGPKQAFLAQTGADTNSAEYKQFNSTVLQPALLRLQAEYPQWFASYIAKQSAPRTIAGLQQKALPLSSVTAWEKIPRIGDMETPKTVMWRSALMYRDQAANQIMELKANHASHAETQQVMDALRQKLQALAGQHPEFAAELGLTTFSRWQDIVEAEALFDQTYPGIAQANG